MNTVDHPIFSTAVRAGLWMLVLLYAAILVAILWGLVEMMTNIVCLMR